MDCLEKTQLILYLTTFGLDAGERRAYEQHLAECPKCRDKINRMQQRLRDLDFENQQECQTMRDSLEAHALGQLADAEQEKVLHHAGECQACKMFLDRLSKFFSSEEVAAWKIRIPPRLAKNIERALEQKFRNSAAGLRDKIPELVQEVKDFVKKIRLSLSPFEPALGFRGEEESRKSDFVEVEHSGGDLVVNAGISGVIVELYSDRGKYLDDGESDEQGKVTFRDMKPGLYKIKVHGHRIEKAE
jgi:hypothetical protein